MDHAHNSWLSLLYSTIVLYDKTPSGVIWIKYYYISSTRGVLSDQVSASLLSATCLLLEQHWEDISWVWVKFIPHWKLSTEVEIYNSQFPITRDLCCGICKGKINSEVSTSSCLYIKAIKLLKRNFLTLLLLLLSSILVKRQGLHKRLGLQTCSPKRTSTRYKDNTQIQKQQKQNNNELKKKVTEGNTESLICRILGSTRKGELIKKKGKLIRIDGGYRSV